MTTGQAGKICSVTPDTILKWIRSGRLPAHRTAGGHHRIDRRDLQRVLVPTEQPAGDPPQARHRRQFRYCWEYNGKGKLLEDCQECVVYQMRAQRCYDVVKLAPEIGHTKAFCKGSCLECDYYRRVREQDTNVLVVTDDASLTDSLKKDAVSAPFNLEVTDCEYTCSAVVDMFRPDFAVVDCSLGPQVSGDICNHLIQDPRIPFVRVILAANEGESPNACDKEVFARIEKPFGIREINEFIDGIREADITTGR